MSDSNFGNGCAVFAVAAKLCVVGGLLLRSCDDVARVAVKSGDSFSSIRHTDEVIDFGSGAKPFSSFDEAGDIGKVAPDLPYSPLDRAIYSIGGESEEVGKLGRPYSEPNPPVSNIRTVSIIPDRSSFDRIFPGEKLTNGLEKEFTELRDTFSQMNRSTLLSDEAGFDQLAKLGSEGGEGEIIILVGHSEKAEGDRIFRFGNGEEYEIEKLHEMSRENGFHLMVLTCRSPDFSLSRNVSYREARSIIKSLQNNTSLRTKADLIRAVKMELVLKDVKVGVAYVAPVGGATVYHFSKEKTNK